MKTSANFTRLAAVAATASLTAVSAYGMGIAGVETGMDVDEAIERLREANPQFHVSEILREGELWGLKGEHAFKEDRSYGSDILVVGLTPEGKVWFIGRDRRDQEGARPRMDDMRTAFTRIAGQTVRLENNALNHTSYIDRKGKKLEASNCVIETETLSYMFYTRAPFSSDVVRLGGDFNPPRRVSAECAQSKEMLAYADREGNALGYVVKLADIAMLYDALKATGRDQKQEQARPKPAL
mgnify:FL=1